MFTMKIHKKIICFSLFLAFFFPNPVYADQSSLSESKDYNKSGNIHYDQHQYYLAIIDYTKAIELNPQYANTYWNRGNAYCNRLKFELAIADYTKAIELNPQDADFYSNRGYTYARRLNTCHLAIADYTKAIALNPQKILYYINRGEAYRSIDRKLAIDDFNQALKMDPSDEDAYFGKYRLLKYGSCGVYNYYDSYIRDTSYNPFR